MIVGQATELFAVLAFGDRPVAIWRKSGTGLATVTFLTTDHLGTPILAMNNLGNATWSGGFEPFGRDYTNPTAESSRIFLRLPGQWDDPIFADSTLGAEDFYSVRRWIETQTARYTSTDPLGVMFTPSLYGYASARPLALTDPFGLWEAAGPGWVNRRPRESTIVCLGGSVVPSLGEFNDATEQQCCWRCIWAHELVHARDAMKAKPDVCKGVDDGWVVRATPSEKQESEQRAWTRMLLCFEALAAEMQKNPPGFPTKCKGDVERLRRYVLDTLSGGQFP
jgi:RHS repeat-associated protein